MQEKVQCTVHKWGKKWSDSGVLVIECLEFREVWSLRDTKARASHWKDGTNSLPHWESAAPVWKFLLDIYLVEVVFVPRVQG